MEQVPLVSSVFQCELVSRRVKLLLRRELSIMGGCLPLLRDRLRCGVALAAEWR